jgi:hypothetical protein
MAARRAAQQGSTARWGAALLGLFVVVMGGTGALLVRGLDHRPVTASDGRTVDIGVRWPGGVDSCVTDAELGVLPNCYREPVDLDAFVKQPASTASTFAFCAVGLAILLVGDRERRHRPAAARWAARDQTWLGFVALAMGPGSALFHGTLTLWGGWGDQLSMYALLAAIVATDAARLTGAPHRYPRWFWGAFAIAAVLKGVSGEAATYVFIATGVGVGVFALVSWARLLDRAGLARSGRRLALAYALLAAAIVPWLISNPSAGDPTDVPWHSAWHLLSAIFVGAYWWYLRSERVILSGTRA